MLVYQTVIILYAMLYNIDMAAASIYNNFNKRHYRQQQDTNSRLQELYCIMRRWIIELKITRALLYY